MKQNINIEKIRDKVVYKTIFSGEEMWQMYTDNSFSVFEININTEGFGYTKQGIRLSDDIKTKSDHELVDLGLISESEYKEACKIEELFQETQLAINQNKQNNTTRKFKCTGCGINRPCFVETNQGENQMFEIDAIDDLKCILDETNQTSFNWVDVE